MSQKLTELQFHASALPVDIKTIENVTFLHTLPSVKASFSQCKSNLNTLAAQKQVDLLSTDGSLRLSKDALYWVPSSSSQVFLIPMRAISTFGVNQEDSTGTSILLISFVDDFDSISFDIQQYLDEQSPQEASSNLPSFIFLENMTLQSTSCMF